VTKIVEVRDLAEQARVNRALVKDFEHGPAPGDFHHADHVRVAFAYISVFPVLEAIARFSADLKHFALSKGKPNLYHETITWAYLLLIRQRVAQVDPPPTWEEFAERNPDLLVWRGGVIERYYLPETLKSDFARRTFVLPDAWGRGADSLVSNTSVALPAQQDPSL
jgi:hypothetical protein